MVQFLSEVLNVEQYPLTVMDRPIESETCKIMENSYRATILAFMDEWSLLRRAERGGPHEGDPGHQGAADPQQHYVPGPGIGGYCLPKDGALGHVGLSGHLLGDEDDDPFRITTAAININDTRGVHAAELVCDALMAHGPAGGRGADPHLWGELPRGRGGHALQRLGVDRPPAGRAGAEIRVHDPYVDHWHELENQDTYPAAGQSRSRFFRNQERVTNIRSRRTSPPPSLAQTPSSLPFDTRPT